MITRVSSVCSIGAWATLGCVPLALGQRLDVFHWHLGNAWMCSIGAWATLGQGRDVGEEKERKTQQRVS